MPDSVLGGVLGIHVEEARGLYDTRAAQMSAPNVSLDGLGRLDERLVAHLDGLAVASDAGRRSVGPALEDPSSGVVFAVAVRAIEDGQTTSLEQFWGLANDGRPVRDGLISAFGWVERRHLQGLVRDVLKSGQPAKQMAGLAACARHQADPGLGSGPWLQDSVPAVRASALRAVGEMGLCDLVSRCVAAMSDADPDCQAWAAWAAVLLGDRGVALEALTTNGAMDGRHRARAFRLSLQAMSPGVAHGVLRGLAQAPANLRWLIQGSGIAGDPVYVPWLIGHMTAPETARLAGEAFTLITGADLDALQLWRAQPEDFESGPNENPDDENVEIDPDEGLMWPDPEKVQRWWDANAARFQKGARYFMGAPVTRAHCIDVLKNGYQRQRIFAAHYLCLLDPGTPLFNTSAPAWRQQKLLAEMT
jgi:uncharacterized protein (TIGR02270 family)